MAGDQTSFLPISSPDSPSSHQPIPEHPPVVRPQPVRTASEPSRAAASRDEFIYRETRLDSLVDRQSLPVGCMITITPADQFRSELQRANQALRQADEALTGETPSSELALVHLTEAHEAINTLQQSMGCRQDSIVARLMSRYFANLEQIPQADRDVAGAELLGHMDHFTVERPDGGTREFRFSGGQLSTIDIEPGSSVVFTELNSPPANLQERIE